uniref:Candidate secreted effector n=1 Tax=Meloidogyne incognita TaxID=6306 RepID=A0A914L0P2_MELIC
MALTATSTLFFSTATGRTSITTSKTKSIKIVGYSRSRGVSHISSSTDTPCTSMSNSHNPASCVRCVHARSRRTKRS